MRAKPRPPLNRLHRITGAGAAGVLLYLLATGIPLQFTDAASLGGRFVSNPLILDWYGLHPPQSAQTSGDSVFIGNRLFWLSQPVSELASYQGTLRNHGYIITAAGSEMILFPADEPTQLERIDVPERIEKLGEYNDRVYLLMGADLMQLDDSLLNLAPADIEATRVGWIYPQPLTGTALETHQRAFRSRLLSMERLLQDLHSGRAFGVIGVWLINLASLALIVLSITGLLIWWRSRSQGASG